MRWSSPKFPGGAGGVEVAERDELEAVDFVVPAENFLEDEFRLAVGVDRALRQRLVDGHALGRAEGGAGGGEDEFFAPADHGVEQIDAAADVIAEILRGVVHRFADERIGGEMHHGFRAALLQRVLMSHGPAGRPR